MAKHIFLRINQGSFAEGFNLTFQMGKEGEIFSTGRDYRFPATSIDIPKLYENWRSNYVNLERFITFRNSSRLGNRFRPEDLTEIREQCRQSYQALKTGINSWLNQYNDQKFIDLRDKLLQELGNSQGQKEEVRLFIQKQKENEVDIFNKLPWIEWETLSITQSKLSVAISPFNFDKAERSNFNPEQNHLKILAILGNSQGINLEEERTILEESLPGNPEVRFIAEPPREQVSESLWSGNWDILFFAGHSSSRNAEGRIYTRTQPPDYLTIEDLKPGLKNAIEQGLKLAIFNSCDGLQLAYDLASLNIPQLIVMREPVPDQVAQKFFKYFLKSFSEGNSLYLSVETARQRLVTDGLDDDFPGVTMLPIICQNPGEVSLRWMTEATNQVDFVPKKTIPPNKGTWKCEHILTGHSDIIKSVAISPNGEMLASCSLDQTIKLWNLKTGELLKTITGHQGGVTCVKFSKDGRTLASSSASPDGTIKLWDTQTQQLKMTLKGDDWVVLSIWSIALSPDGKTLVSGHHADSTVKVWDLETGTLKHTLRGHVWAVHDVDISPDGQMIASGSFDSNIKLWNLHTGREIRNLNGPGDGPVGWTRSFFSDRTVYSLAFSPDGKTLASGGEKQPIKLWRLSSGEVKITLTGHTDKVYCVTFSSDGNFLASGSSDRTIRIWDLLTAEPIYTLGHSDTIYALTFSPDGQTLVSGGKDRTLRIWHLLR